MHRQYKTQYSMRVCVVSPIKGLLKLKNLRVETAVATVVEYVMATVVVGQL